MGHSISILVIVLLVRAEVWKEHIYSLLKEFWNCFIVSHYVDQLDHQELYLLFGNIRQINSCLCVRIDQEIGLTIDVLDLRKEKLLIQVQDVDASQRLKILMDDIFFIKA